MKRVIYTIVGGLIALLLGGCGAANPVPEQGYTEKQFVEVMKLDQLIVRPIAFSQDGKRLMTMEGTFENDLYAFDMKTGKKVRIYNNKMDQKAIETYLQKVDWKKEMEETETYHHMKPADQERLGLLVSAFDAAQQDDRIILDARWSPDGKKVAMLANIVGWKMICSVFDEKSGEVTILRVFPQQNKAGTSGSARAGVSWNGNDKVVYGFQYDNGFLVFERDLLTQKDRKLLEMNKATRLYYSPDGKKVAYYVPKINKSSFPGTPDEILEELWIADSSFENPELITDHPAIYGTISWAKDSSFLIFHNGKKDSMAPKMIVCLYDVTAKKIKPIAGDRIYASALTEDNEIIFTWDNRIFKTSLPR